MDRRCDRAKLAQPRPAGRRRAARTRAHLAGMPARHDRPHRHAARPRDRRQRRGLARAGNRHGQPAHADQLPGCRASRHPRSLGRGPPQRGSCRAFAGLLPGRRRELSARQPVRRRRAGAGARRDRPRRQRPADRVSLSRRRSLPDRRRRRVSQSRGPAHRLSELCHHARRPGADSRRQHRRSRSCRRRHPHHQRTWARAVRATDLHAAGPARVVRAPADGRNGRGPQRADLRRASAI